MAVKHQPPLVLVADDEVNTTIMIQRIFEREGYQVARFNDGITALQGAQDLVPDLILLDIRMPGIDGFNVLQKLRDNPTTSQIPTILVTANAREPADVARGMHLGADDYIYKPFAPQELVARAQSKMRARQLEDALQRRTQELEALLRVSEELNQHLEGADLQRVVLDLVLQMLPGEVAGIYQLDEEYELISHQIQQKPGIDYGGLIDENEVLYRFLPSPTATMWPDQAPLVDGVLSGMAVPLRHGDQLLGLLIILSQTELFDESHFRLFMGIGRQAALAMRNALLHEIQVNYGLHLEDMVAARTAELQSAQQMLVRSEKLASIGHLAANIAHEINNPLQPITVTLDDMVENVQHNQPVDIRGIEIIQESVERIRRIVSQLLEFTGKRNMGPDLQVIDIGNILERIRDLNRKFFEKERMALDLDAPALPPVYGSKDQLEQVFMNLTLNAQAAMKAGGKLKIKALSEGNEIIIQFIDNGCGIPANQIDKIFDPFFSTKPNGTGLGLFVTYGIIQGHHGSIEVNSKVNAGSTFTLHLPAYTPVATERR